MTRRAEWISRDDSFRAALAHRLVEVTPIRWFVFVLFLSLLMILRASALGASHHNFAWLGLDFPFYLLIAAKLAFKRSQLDMNGELRERFNRAPSGAYPVRIKFIQDEKFQGHDEGLVRFENGALVYEGLACRFRLRPQDVFVPPDSYAKGPTPNEPVERRRYGNEVERNAWGFHLAEDPGCRLYFLPLLVRSTVFGFPIGPREEPVYRPLFDWLARRPNSVEEPLLPPAGPPPSHRVPLWMRYLFGRETR